MKISRRNLGLGTAALVLLGVGAEGYRRYFGPWYAPTPYDDLLNQIADREPARVFGGAALKAMPGSNAASLARVLRGQATLAKAAASDPAQDRVTEVSGWVVPQSVAHYAALAALV